jgi:hypothetical protein
MPRNSSFKTLCNYEVVLNSNCNRPEFGVYFVNTL